MDFDLKQFLGETTDYDKKAALEERRPKSWLKSVSAFANGDGGTLIFGVADDDTVVGLENVKHISEVISEIIKMKMQPVPETRLQIHKVDGKDVMTLEVRHGDDTPYYFASDGRLETYTRIGNESVAADNVTIKRLVLRGRKLSWDSLPSGYKLADFPFSHFRGQYYQWMHASFDDKTYESYGICDNKGELTNAGALLADKSPFWHSRLFCNRWNGLDKSGGLMEAIDSAEYNGSLLLQLENGMNFLRKHNHKMWKKLPTERLEYFDYIERSVFEALVNALVHRDYMETGSEVHFDMFDDRLEIYSPGGMLDGSNIQDLDLSAVPSRRRNPIVADIFGRLGLMEREGSGLNKIMRFYKAANNYDERKSPAFYSDRTLFRVIFYNLNYMPQMEGHAQQDVPPSVPPSVSPSDQQNPLEPLILGMMMANPHITRQEMAGHIKKSVKTVSRIISNMSNVRYVGSKSTGHWEIDD